MSELYIPIRDVLQPTDGPVLCFKWWCIDKEKGLCLKIDEESQEVEDSYSEDEELQRVKFQQPFFPNAEVLKIPVVFYGFVEHTLRRYKQIKAQDLEN